MCYETNHKLLICKLVLILLLVRNVYFPNVKYFALMEKFSFDITLRANVSTIDLVPSINFLYKHSSVILLVLLPHFQWYHLKEKNTLQ